MLSKTRAAFNMRGVIPAVFTPLNDDRTVNCKVIPAYVQYLTTNGIQSVLVGGTTGEHMCLSVNDRKKVIDAWVDAARGNNLHVQVQVGGAPFPDVIELTKYCAANGVNSILTLPELYFRPQSVEELVSFVEMVADAASGLPILYYHNPVRSNVTINMPSFVSCATERIPTFKGLKFASADLVEAAKIVKVIGEDQQIFLGGERLLAPAALLGIKHCICTSVNVFRKEFQEILQAVKNNNVEKAREIQKKLTIAVDSISAEGQWVTTLKAAMEILSGIKMGPPTLPNKPLSIKSWKNIEEKLKALGY